MRSPGIYRDVNGPLSSYSAITTMEASVLPSRHDPLDTLDIAGAKPKKLTSQRLVTPIDSLDVVDITKSLDSHKRLFSQENKKLRNPLDPEYDLPPLPPPPPPEHQRFLRDTLNVSDIVGPPKKLQPERPLKSLDASDIDIRPPSRPKTFRRETLDVSDIVGEPNDKRKLNRETLQQSSSVDDMGFEKDFGFEKTFEWKMRNYQHIRLRGGKEKHALDQLAHTVSPHITEEAMMNLQIQLKYKDKPKTGKVTQKELREAFEKAGLANHAGGALLGSSDHDLVQYKPLLARLFGALEKKNSSLEETKTVCLPKWYNAQQRGLNTGAAAALNHLRTPSQIFSEDLRDSKTRFSEGFRNREPQKQELREGRGAAWEKKEVLKKRAAPRERSEKSRGGNGAVPNICYRGGEYKKRDDQETGLPPMLEWWNDDSNNPKWIEEEVQEVQRLNL